MSLRKKAFVAIVLVFSNFFGTIGILQAVAPRFILLAVFWPVAGGIYLLCLRCPKCGTPMYKRRTKAFGMEFTYWGGAAIPKTCSRCGNKF